MDGERIAKRVYDLEVEGDEVEEGHVRGGWMQRYQF